MKNLYTKKSVDFQYTDARGCLIQLVHNGYKQINILESKKGAQRGSHFHKVSIEAFYIINGVVEVTFWGKLHRQTVVFKNGDFFEIHPYILHNMLFLEDCLMVQLYNTPIEKKDGTKDIYTEKDFL